MSGHARSARWQDGSTRLKHALLRSPLHRKAMETDSNILSVMSQLHPSYAWENPDLSLDSTDPFRARRRTWLQLTTAWQRGSLHRQFFFPNGRITNGELATSRHIATDSALRSITAVRELRKMQNRFSDYMSSAWWFQYLTEPSMTLATAALLLIRSKGQGVPGLASEATCWPTMMHFTKTIDECLEDLQGSTRNPAACLPSFLAFAQGCIKLIRQLRSAVHTSLEALVKSQPDLASLQNFEIDEKLIPLLHPRSRQKSPVSQTPQPRARAAKAAVVALISLPSKAQKRLARRPERLLQTVERGRVSAAGTMTSLRVHRTPAPRPKQPTQRICPSLHDLRLHFQTSTARQQQRQQQQQQPQHRCMGSPRYLSMDQLTCSARRMHTAEVVSMVDLSTTKHTATHPLRLGNSPATYLRVH